jgi:hypothetical protein
VGRVESIPGSSGGSIVHPGRLDRVAGVFSIFG